MNWTVPNSTCKHCPSHTTCWARTVHQTAQETSCDEAMYERQYFVGSALLPGLLASCAAVLRRPCAPHARRLRSYSPVLTLHWMSTTVTDLRSLCLDSAGGKFEQHCFVLRAAGSDRRDHAVWRQCSCRWPRHQQPVGLESADQLPPQSLLFLPFHRYCRCCRCCPVRGATGRCASNETPL